MDGKNVKYAKLDLLKDVFFVYGWSDNVLKYLTFDVNKQVEDVKNYKMKNV